MEFLQWNAWNHDSKLRSSEADAWAVVSSAYLLRFSNAYRKIAPNVAVPIPPITGKGTA
jgi:hypothetical protein